MRKETIIKVKRILRESTAARNCDSTLFARYLLEHSRFKSSKKALRDSITAAIVLDIPTAETITRIRRKIQEDGCYEATAKTKKERRQKESYCRTNNKKGRF